MKAAGFVEFGGSNVVRLVDVPLPEVGGGQVRIRSVATPVNPADVLYRSGGMGTPPGSTPPWVPGLEVAGIVDQVGSGVTSLEVGDPVAAYTSFSRTGRGTHSEYVLASARSTVKVPTGMDLDRAATVPMNGLTARLAVDTAALKPGQTMAVIGAVGAVGRYAVQIATLFGFRVVALVGERDAEFIAGLGATRVVAMSERPQPDLADAADPEIRVVLDLVGVDSAPELMPLGGRVITVRRREYPVVDDIQAERITVSTYHEDTRRLQELMDWAASGRLTPMEGKRFAPDEAHRAHDMAVARGKRGTRPILSWPDLHA